jgi:pimeloyl-ACP methyl ester carboxylesterase
MSKGILLAIFLFTSLPGWTQTQPKVIVIGFLGGFVSHDESSHPEIQLTKDIEKQFPNAYVNLFENRKAGEAYKTVLALDKDRDARIILFGHSWGAYECLALARRLERAGVPITLTIQIDSVPKPFKNDWLVPSNVQQAISFYQVQGLLHGHPHLIAVDPLYTQVLGTYRVDYNKHFLPRRLSWTSHLFIKGHLQIEYDSAMWTQVKDLITAAATNGTIE